MGVHRDYCGVWEDSIVGGCIRAWNQSRTWLGKTEGDGAGCMWMELACLSNDP